MGRSSRLLLIAAVASALAAGAALAGIPDPQLCDVPNVIIVPDGSLEYVVTVVGAEGPIDSALVEVVFSTETDGLLCWCVGQTRPTVQAYSDALGEASFFISGGGCVDSALAVTPPAVEVFANGIKIAEVGVVSPDVVDGSGLKAQQGWNPAGSCAVTVGDAVYFTGPIANATVDFCADLDSSGGPISISDAVLVTPGITSGASCVAQ